MCRAWIEHRASAEKGGVDMNREMMYNNIISLFSGEWLGLLCFLHSGLFVASDLYSRSICCSSRAHVR